jgi:hypothetical protein
MSAPVLTAYQNGYNQVSGDQLNTFSQWCSTVSQLKGFIGLSGMFVYVEGFTAALDGGQGWFYWNASGSAPDDGGVTTVVPNGAGSGEWNRIQGPTVDTYSYLTPVTGFTITFPNYTNTLILNPLAGLATGTIIFPALLFDGQYISISSSQTISTLTLTPNSGQTIIGAPTTITNTSSIKFIYRAANKTFYRGG